MSEAAPDVPLDSAHDQASVETPAADAAPAAAPAVDESAQASAEPSADAALVVEPVPEPAPEVPAVAPETPVETPAVSASPDVSAPADAPASVPETPAAPVSVPDEEVSAHTVDGVNFAEVPTTGAQGVPAPDKPLYVEPGVLEEDALRIVRADLDRVSTAHDKLQEDNKRMVLEITSLQTQLDDARRQLAGQPPAAAPVAEPVSGEVLTSPGIYDEVKRALGDFFLEHAMPQLAEEPEPAAPASPFISRQ